MCFHLIILVFLPFPDATFSESSEEEEIEQVPQVISTMELPEGARQSDSDDDERPQSDPHRALNIDLDE